MTTKKCSAYSLLIVVSLILACSSGNVLELIDSDTNTNDADITETDGDSPEQDSEIEGPDSDDDCLCSTGPCCDGCHYLTSDVRCSDEPSSYQYRCTQEKAPCGGEAQRLPFYTYCSGESEFCDGSPQADEWETLDVCKGEACESDQDGAICVETTECLPTFNWVLRDVTGPPTRRFHAMAFDSERRVTVLFGGLGIDYVRYNDTWEWDGTTWTEIIPETSPSARSGHAMAYDSTRGVTVLFGGAMFEGRAAGYSDETWEWDGTNWTLREPETVPTTRNFHVMAYDSSREVVIMCAGGTILDIATVLDDTWEWDGTNWTLREPETFPSVRFYSAMAHDSSRGVAVMFGGRRRDGFGYDPSTWEWDGTNWAQIESLNWPAGRSGTSLVYDRSREVSVLFGGGDPSNPYSPIYYNDHWEWNGTDWRQIFPDTRPEIRSSHAMAYDSNREFIVLFGGYTHRDAPSQYLGDTWEYGLVYP